MTDNTDTGSLTLADVKAEADATAAELARHEAAETGSGQTARTTGMGDIVIVRQGDKIAPGIIIDVREDGSLDVQTFHGDHAAHYAHKLIKVTAEAGSGDGWYWKD